jgi:photosystem II stability/assembly factor-like uncharacterized protein
MITAIAVSPSNPDLLAVIGVPTSGIGGQAGIYVSRDGGQNWRFSVPANLPLTAYPYTIVGATGAGGHFYIFFTFGGWFETQDMGLHWRAVTSGALSAMQAPTLLTDPYDPGHLLLGGDQGLFESRDDGLHWQQITAVQGTVISLTASTGSPRWIFCATDQGLYRWRDGQAAGSIERMHGLPAPGTPTRMAIDGAGGVLYALFSTDLWFSATHGETWEHYWHFERHDLVSLVVDPANVRHLVAGFFLPAEVEVSGDGGHSWGILTN